MRSLSALLLDDSDVDLMLYRRLINGCSRFHEIQAFARGQDAIDTLGADPDRTIDLILLDISMPIMSGFDFLVILKRQFTQIYLNTVIVMLTSSLDPKDMEMARRFARVGGYATKPFSGEGLNRVLSIVDGSDHGKHLSHLKLIDP